MTWAHICFQFGRATLECKLIKRRWGLQQRAMRPHAPNYPTTSFSGDVHRGEKCQPGVALGSITMYISMYFLLQQPPCGASLNFRIGPVDALPKKKQMGTKACPPHNQGPVPRFL